MKRLTILITMLMATSGWAYNESDLKKMETIYGCMNCDLSGLDFTIIPWVITKEGPYLKEINLSGANLSGANLSGARFNQAKLSDTNLSGANLSGADLREASLDKANLSGANLSGANFTKAFLTSAKLSEANLDGVVLWMTKLNYADLSNADFTKAERMSRIVLDDAKYCNTTMLWGVLNDDCKADE